MATDTPARIPNAIGTGTKLFGRYTLTDIAVGLTPAVAIALAIKLLVPSNLSVAGVTVQSVALPLVGIGVALGGVIVLLSPSHTDSLTWLTSVGEYFSSTRKQGPTAARDVAQVRRIHPTKNAIERSDGALLGMLSVDPASMALATEAEWAQQANAFSEFLNTRVEFPVQIFSTTRAVSTADHLAPYRRRLESGELDANLAALTREYIEWFESDIQRRESTVRDHYVVVAVPPRSVQFDDEAINGKLANLPVVGFLLQLWSQDPKSALRERQATELQSRLRRLEAGIRSIDGCAARQLPLEDSVRLIARYWRPDDAADSVDVPETATPVIGGEVSE